MNEKDYIESGILERYAMGQCSDAEVRGVQEMLRKHPSLRNELEEIEQALAMYAHAVAQNPSDRVRKNIISHISNSDKKVIPIQRSSRSNWWLAAASVVLLISSIAMNIMQYQQNKSLSGELAEERNRNSSMASDMEVTKASYEETMKALAVVNDTNTQVITLAGTAAFPTMKATVYWNKKSSEVYLAVNNMDIPAPDKDYQLWAIVDGVPVDAGVMDLHGDSLALHKMHSFPKAEAFAITLERKGGSPIPTRELTIVIGNV